MIYRFREQITADVADVAAAATAAEVVNRTRDTVGSFGLDAYGWRLLCMLLLSGSF